MILWMEGILHHQKDGWSRLNNGMFTTYQLVIRISQPSTVCLSFIVHFYQSQYFDQRLTNMLTVYFP